MSFHPSGSYVSSNPREERLLKQANIQEAAARGIFNALQAYFTPGTSR